MREKACKLLNKWNVLLIVLVLSGFWLRFYDIGSQAFWIDEVYSTTAALGILEKGVPTLPSGIVYFRAILHTLLVALSMAVLGVSEFAARMPSLFFGTLSIPLAYLLARKLFDKETALITAFLVTFAAVEIAFSRQARMYQQLQFFYLLSLYLFWKFEQNNSHKNLLLMLAATVLTLLSHELGFSLLVVYVTYLFLTRIPMIREAIQSREAIKKINREQLTAYGMLAGFIILVMILGQWKYGAVTRILSTNVNYTQDYMAYLNLTFPILLYLAPLGALVALRKKPRESLLLVLGILVPFYFVVFHELMVGFRYIYLFFPLLFIFSSKTLLYLSRVLVEPFKEQIEKTGRAKVIKSVPIVVFLLALAFTPTLNFSPKTVYYLAPSAPQPRFDSVYAYLQDNLRDGDTLVVSYPEVALWYNTTPSYWLAFPISGVSAEKWLDKNLTVYKRTNTPAIKSLEELELIYENSSRGFMVIDTRSGHRIPDDYWVFIRNKTEWLEEPSMPSAGGGINIYTWDKT